MRNVPGSAPGCKWNRLLSSVHSPVLVAGKVLFGVVCGVEVRADSSTSSSILILKRFQSQRQYVLVWEGQGAVRFAKLVVWLHIMNQANLQALPLASRFCLKPSTLN